MDIDPKRIVALVLAIVVPVIAAGLFTGLLALLPFEKLLPIVTQHFAAVVGLPFAALLAAFIVIALKHVEGPLRFEGLGFKFEGGSGEVVLWVICFLAITTAIRVLWSAG
jgi:hypothetical protein